jgi:molybdenum cofactor cytidylyltransferase
MKKPPVAGIILAAGRSRRMGRDKLLLDWQGKPILQHVIDAACGSDLSPLLLVVNQENTVLINHINLEPCRLIRHRGEVYSDSLRAGLAALDANCAGVMFLLGDQPLVTTETIAQLIAAFQLEPDRWVAPLFQGRRGNPVIAPAAWFDHIHSLQGDTGPRRSLLDPAARLNLVDVADAGVVFDVDTPDDLHKLHTGNFLAGIKKPS